MPTITQARIQAFTGNISFEPTPPPSVTPTSTSTTIVPATLGPTGPTGPQGEVGPTGPLRTAATMEIQWNSGAAVANDTVYFIYNPLYSGRINSLTYFTATGSYTVAVKIGAAYVGNLSVISVTSPTPTTLVTTTPNVFMPGQPITAVITSATGNPTDTVLSLNVTWL